MGGVWWCGRQGVREDRCRVWEPLMLQLDARAATCTEFCAAGVLCVFVQAELPCQQQQVAAVVTAFCWKRSCWCGQACTCPFHPMCDIVAGVWRSRVMSCVGQGQGSLCCVSVSAMLTCLGSYCKF